MAAETTRREITDDLLQALREGFRGPLLRPGDEGYEAAREIWNAMYTDREPTLIARCTGTADIVAAVNFARENGLSPAVRGGGHGAPGYALPEDDMMIDLSLMRTVFVDPARRRARAQGGATWAEYDRETQAYGLASPGGAVSDTGIAGLTLGGGYGHLSRKYGMAVDSLVGAEIVLADGTIVHVSQDENEELFWAIRGGGGNFGIVSSFEYEVYPVGPLVWGGGHVYGFDDAREVYRFYRDWCANSDPDLGLNCVMMSGAQLPFLPEDQQDKPYIALIAVWPGEESRAEEVLKPLREFGNPVFNFLERHPYTEVQTMFDNIGTGGRRSYWKSGLIDDLTDEAIDVLVEYGAKFSSPLSTNELACLGSGILRNERGATAVGHRSPGFNQLAVSFWEDPKEDDTHIEFTRQFFDALHPYHSAGVYVNYLGREGADRVGDAYGQEIFGRLSRIKAKYDPNNFFRRNQNIPPAS
jgi:FAD/FMN-containing dehydrogenase